MMETIDGGPAPIHQFSQALADGFRRSPIDTAITNEGNLDRAFLIRETEKVISKVGFEFEIAVHPWNNRKRCAGRHNGPRAELGCPNCWAESKSWASVHLW